jgi:hypothetical protein
LTTGSADLLLLRLDTLGSDIAKVRAAVERAEQRGQFLRDALDNISPHRANIWAVAETVQSLVAAMDREAGLPTLMEEARHNLARDIREAPALLTAAAGGIDSSAQSLSDAKQMSVILNDEGLRALRTSLNHRCNDLDTKLEALRITVHDTPSQRREQWVAYQHLLDSVARPVFVDYVDFLSGLTVRDTGLDDQVCDMADRLLTRYTGLIKRSLPLPARQAALGNAMDSVVLLGFPEWSIWGIPLVGHEVGMAYLQNKTDPDLLHLAQEFVPRVPSAGTEEGATNAPDAPSHAKATEPAPSEKYVHHLLADAFATYTLGLSYACAALLLRLSPRHDQPPPTDYPKDIDRARMIMLMLSSGGTVQTSGGNFSDAIGTLKKIWEGAVGVNADGEPKDHPAKESANPTKVEDWLDELAKSAANHFQGLLQIRPYDNERWAASDKWIDALRTGGPTPSWMPYDDAVPDVLTAAWRLRLFGEARDNLAENIKQRWSERQRRGR